MSVWKTSGTYEIDVTYGGQSSKTTFQFSTTGSTKPGPQPIMGHEIIVVTNKASYDIGDKTIVVFGYPLHPHAYLKMITLTIINPIGQVVYSEQPPLEDNSEFNVGIIITSLWQPSGMYTVKVQYDNDISQTVFQYTAENPSQIDQSSISKTQNPAISHNLSDKQAIPEFPFAIIVLVIATFSIVVISRMRHTF